MRYIKLISIIFIISVFSACSSSPYKKDSEVTAVLQSPGITAGTLNSPKVENSTVPKQLIESSPADIIAIDRNQAGLSTIVPLDFTKFSINKRLKELLADPESYKNNDYKNGIVIGEEVLVTERYKGNIINDIRIGSSVDYVKKVLGEPNVIADEGFIFYKTKDFYIGFMAYSKVEYAILFNRSIRNNKDILKRIIRELDAKNDLGEMIHNNDKMADIFEENGHINGGGWYANLYSGIQIYQFNDENSITIYNNFEDDLYRANNFKYDIKFVDSDYQVKNAISSIQVYIDNNYEFETLGVLSPSGKLKCTYYWGYSMSYYFTIRTLDNSKPDFRVPVPAHDFKWLTDNYILYLNAWTSAPCIVKVSDNSEPDEHVNVMYKLGVFDKDDDFQDTSFQYSIKGINGNTINLYDSESNKEYNVVYSIGNNGIELKFANK